MSRSSARVHLAWLAAPVVLSVVAAPAAAQRTAPVIERSTVLPVDDYHRIYGRIKPGFEGAAPPASPRGEERPRILLTGYWPPSNEAIRKFSTDPVQNPNGWLGDNWEGRGYDVHAFFPEFNPADCDFCGKGDGDFEVDYQDTSDDWWRIVDEIQPIAIITFSRGFIDNSWELEMNQYNRTTWIDDYVAPRQPTPSPPDDSVPAGHLRNSSLPVQNIVDEVNNAGLGVNAYICWSGDGGGFLSEFMAYHGVWTKEKYGSPADPRWVVCAGHVHVGGQLTWGQARKSARITLREVIKYTDSVRASTTCQTDLGFGGPGTSQLQVCGDDLTAGGFADLMLADALPDTPAFLFVGTQFNPTPFEGGTLVPLPPDLIWIRTTDADGRFFQPSIPGGAGPLTVFAQFVYPDAALTQGWGLSNAVQIDILP